MTFPGREDRWRDWVDFCASFRKPEAVPGLM